MDIFVLVVNLLLFQARFINADVYFLVKKCVYANCWAVVAEFPNHF